MLAVVDANKDIIEMQEVYDEQEKNLMGRARQHTTEEDDDNKENISVPIFNKRIADVKDIDDGGRKVVLMEKGRI